MAKKSPPRPELPPQLTPPKSSLVDLVFSARCAGVSLAAIRTADPAATRRKLLAGGALRAIERDDAPEPDVDAPLARLFQWDAASGLVALTPESREALAASAGDVDVAAATEKLENALHFAQALPSDSVLFVLNAHRLLGSDPGDLPAVQACWNLRDAFMGNFRCLVLLVPSLHLPEELQQDVVVFDDAPPDEAALLALVAERAGEAGVEVPTADARRAALALRGLCDEPAARVVAMSLRRSGLDVDAMWERKKATIEQVPGLSVLRGPETYADLRDLDGVVEFLRRLADGPDAPAVVVMLDEFEKSMAGSQTEGGDSTGISQDRLQVILHAIEENDWKGVLLYGVPGAGKTLTIKAFANESRALPLKLDLGATQDKHVGVSEARIRRVMDTLLAAGGKSRVFFAASCNKMVTLPAELKRRFPIEWFYDLPSDVGRYAIWELMAKKFGLGHGELPDDRDWTGADIRNCCDLARRLKVEPKEAARYVVPVAKSDPGAIESARRHADGRLLDAARGGVYVSPSKRASVADAQKRSVKL